MFSVLDDLGTQELPNAFIYALYYIRLMQLYYSRIISFLMINSKIISYSSINTHYYYLPTELQFKTNFEITLSKASRAVIDRFLIILNIYNKTIDDNTL